MLATKLPHRPDRLALAHLDALLDEALQETFPASDSIAVTSELERRGSKQTHALRCALLRRSRMASWAVE